jgi:hypothetical protein
VSVELTEAERAYLIGLDWSTGAERLARYLTGDSTTGVLVSDLLEQDGPSAEGS